MAEGFLGRLPHPIPQLDHVLAGPVQLRHRLLQLPLGILAALDRVHMPGQLDLQGFHLAIGGSVGALLRSVHQLLSFLTAPKWDWMHLAPFWATP